MAVKDEWLSRVVEVPATEQVKMRRWGQVMRIERVAGSADVLVETDRPAPGLTDCRAVASADAAGDQMRPGLTRRLRGNDSGTWLAIGGLPGAWVAGDWLWVD